MYRSSKPFRSNLRAEGAEYHPGNIVVVLHHLNVSEALAPHDPQHVVRLTDAGGNVWTDTRPLSEKT